MAPVKSGNTQRFLIDQLLVVDSATTPSLGSGANTSAKFTSPNNKTFNPYPRPKRNPSHVAFSQNETAEKRGKHVIHLEANGETRKMWENKCGTVNTATGEAT